MYTRLEEKLRLVEERFGKYGHGREERKLNGIGRGDCGDDDDEPGNHNQRRYHMSDDTFRVGSEDRGHLYSGWIYNNYDIYIIIL